MNVGRLLPALLWAAACFGQAGKAELFGTVTDPSGAVAPGARIEAVHRATGAVYAGTSDERGVYHLLGLPAGEYTLAATAAGFVPFRQTGLALRLGDQIDVGIRLALGGAESIEVTAQAPLLQITSGSVAYAVDQAKLSALPLDGRNFVALIALFPGAGRCSRALTAAARGPTNISTMASASCSPNRAKWPSIRSWTASKSFA